MNVDARESQWEIRNLEVEKLNSSNIVWNTNL